MKRGILFACLMSVTMFGTAFAVDLTPDEQAQVQQQIEYKRAELAALQAEGQRLDSEIASCKKVKTGAAIATGVGAVGTVATGIALGVKASEVKSKKTELNNLQSK